MSHKGFCVYHNAHGMGKHFSGSLKEMVPFISDQVSEVALFIYLHMKGCKPDLPPRFVQWIEESSAAPLSS